MIAHSLSRQAYTGLRPIEPARDLKAITDLLSLAFVEELSPETEATLREMRFMAGLSPVLTVLSQLQSSFYDVFSGFVWEEAGTIAGNVTLTPFERDRRHWLISNVAVHPGYRQRGIARRLMEAALEQIYQNDGAFVSLEVRRGNAAARRLYQTLGFVHVEANAHLRAEALPIFPAPSAGDFVVLPADDFVVRNWRPGEGHRVYGLVTSTRPPLAQRWLPIDRGPFAPGLLGSWLEPVAQALRAERTLRKVVLHDGELCGMALIKARLLGRPHEGQLMVHPRFSGQVDDLLVGSVLAELQRLPARPTQLRVLQAAPSLVAALERRGFQIVRILERMGLSLSGQRGPSQPVGVVDR